MGSPGRIPLCVDCDGTITPTDLLHESVFGMLRSRPWQLFSFRSGCFEAGLS